MLNVVSYSTGYRNFWNKNFTDSTFDEKNIDECIEIIYEKLKIQSRLSSESIFIDSKDGYIHKGDKNIFVRIPKDTIDLTNTGLGTFSNPYVRLIKYVSDNSEDRNIDEELLDIVVNIINRRINQQSANIKINRLFDKYKVISAPKIIDDAVRYLCPDQYNEFVLLRFK